MYIILYRYYIYRILRYIFFQFQIDIASYILQYIHCAVIHKYIQHGRINGKHDIIELEFRKHLFF